MHNLRLYVLTLTGTDDLGEGRLETHIVWAKSQSQAFEIANIATAMDRGCFDTVEVKDITVPIDGQAGEVYHILG